MRREVAFPTEENGRVKSSPADTKRGEKKM